MIDFIFILIIANVIPLILRFIIFRRQLSKLASFLVIIPVLFINIIFLAFIQDYTGGDGYVRGTSFLGPAAIISYFILRKGNKLKDEPEETSEVETPPIHKEQKSGVFCGNCGKSNSNEANYCKFCGNKL